MRTILLITMHVLVFLVVSSSWLPRNGGIFNSKPKCDIFFPNCINLRTSSVDFVVSDKPKVRRISFSFLLDFNQFLLSVRFRVN